MVVNRIYLSVSVGSVWFGQIGCHPDANSSYRRFGRNGSLLADACRPYEMVCLRPPMFTTLSQTAAPLSDRRENRSRNTHYCPQTFYSSSVFTCTIYWLICLCCMQMYILYLYRLTWQRPPTNYTGCGTKVIDVSIQSKTVYRKLPIFLADFAVCRPGV